MGTCQTGSKPNTNQFELIIVIKPACCIFRPAFGCWACQPLFKIDFNTFLMKKTEKTEKEQKSKKIETKFCKKVFFEFA